MPKTVFIATCEQWPDLHPDDRGIIEGLRARGRHALPAVWNDPAVDWQAGQAVVLRSTWDYTRARPEFLEWLEGLPCPVFNPAEVVRWNTDKRYLETLRVAGVPITPTFYLEVGASLPDELGAKECVVKPSVSAGSQDTIRLATDDRRAISAHVEAIHRQGKTVMVQPYLSGVESQGETALLYIDGRFSHAIRKGPILRETGRVATDSLFALEAVEAREPTADERELAARVLAALPFSGLLYTRVDLIPDDEGAPVVLEVELTEPSIFFEHGPGSQDRFVEAIVSRL